MVVAILLAPGLCRAGDENPCAHLIGEDATRYNELADSSRKHYAEEEFAEAVEAILELRKLCDEDPRLDFNLARSYQRAGNCNMARFWFEQLLAHLATASHALAENRPKLAEKALKELSLQCPESARIAFETDDVAARVVLEPLDVPGEAMTFTHPFLARVDAGRYRVTIESEGFQTTTYEVTVETDVDNQMILPRLAPDTLLPEATVRCPEGVDSTSWRNGDEVRTIYCDQSTTLSEGAWTVGFELAGYSFEEQVELEQNREVELVLPTPATPESDVGLRGWGWATMITGVSLVAGGGALFTAAELMDVGTLVPSAVDTDGEILGYRKAHDSDVVEALQISSYVVGGTGAALAITGAILILVGDDEPAPVGVSAGPDGRFSLTFQTRL